MNAGIRQMLVRWRTKADEADAEGDTKLADALREAADYLEEKYT